jgi:hypothetical protein
MDVCVLIFGGNAHWKLALDSPLLYEIPSSPGVQLISPLLFEEIRMHMDAKLVRSGEPSSGFIDDLSLFETDGIAFIIEDEFVERYRPRDISRLASYFSQDDPPLIDTAITLLSALRHFSKQTGLCTSGDDLNLWEWLVLDDLPTVKRREKSGWSRAVAKSIVATAITLEQIEAACTYGPGFRAPIYDGVFLDAVGSHAAHDYRASILYSAIALEAVTALVLDQYFETSIKPHEAKEWRVISRSIGGGKAVRKDPIWELLRKREDANSLLHEGALYVLGKSLLVEDEALFQRVQCLRATRNKIVHEGEPPESPSNQYLSLDIRGSSDALNCVDAVFRWLGVGYDYGLYERGLVELSQSVTGEIPESGAS